MGDASRNVAFMAGAFAGSLLLAYLVSRLGLYLRRSSRFEPGTVVGVHILSFFLLGAVACSAKAASPGSSGFVAFVAQLIILLIDLLRLPRPEDYSDDVPQSLRPLEGMRLVAVIGSILLGFGLVYFLARPATDGEIIAEIERSINEAPGGSVYVEALKRDFPQEYQALMIDTAQRLRAARVQRNGSASDTRIGEEAGMRLLALIESKSHAMTKAPAPALNAYARSMKDFVTALQKSSQTKCAAVVTGPVGDEAQMPSPPAAEEAVARMLAARLDLARAGLDHPTVRAAVPPQDWVQQLRDEVQARDPRLARYLGNPAMASMLTTRERCAIAVHYYSAIADLPPHISASLTAYDVGLAASPGSGEASARPPGG